MTELNFKKEYNKASSNKNNGVVVWENGQGTS